MSQLPEGWCLTKIGDVSIKGEQRKAEIHETFYYVDIGCIDREKKTIFKPQLISGKDAPSRARKKISTGDVLVSLTRPNLNAVAYVPVELDGQIASTGFEVIKTVLVDSRYLFGLTKSKSFIDAISGAVQGALYPAAKSSDVQAFEFPLPPLAEQKAIAQTLDTLLAQVEITKARLDRIPDILKRFRQSVLAAAVSGKLTEEWRSLNTHSASDFVVEIQESRFRLWCEHEKEKHYQKGKNPSGNWKKKYKVAKTEAMRNDIPDTWGCLSWGEISMWITYGFTKPMPHVGEGPLIVTAKNVRDGRVDTSNAHRTTLEAYEKLNPKDKPTDGDILIVKDGATTGRASIAPDGLGEYCVSQSVAVVWLKYSPLNRKYLLWNVQSRDSQSRIQELMAGMAMPHLSITDFGKMLVPIPPKLEVEEIVKQVETLFAHADAIEQQVQAAQTRVNSLTQSILAKAFRGELTAEWRAANPELISGENSAEALLAKIQAERDAAKPKKKARARK